MQRLVCAVLAFAWGPYGPTLSAQNPHASRVVSHDEMGQVGGGIFQPSNTLGQPDGAVHSLGIGGNIVVGFSVVIADGPGADLIIGENPFRSTSNPAETFAEVMFVEVSTDGLQFARVPNRYSGPLVSPGPFAFINSAYYEGFAGATPLAVGASDPLDVVLAGGDAIDLSDLANHPLVQSGQVDLQQIREVRLVDVRDGTDRDSRGRVIHDPGDGSADVDAVSVIHHAANLTGNGPTVNVCVPVDGAFSISFDDPNGIGDLDPASLRVALYGIEVSLGALLPAMRFTRSSSTGFELKLVGSLPRGFALRVSASVKDRAGNRSGDTRSRPL